MVAQIISLFTGLEEFKAQQDAFISLQKFKRVRYAIPTYIKFYSIYQYDRLKFRELMNEWLKSEEGKNRTYQTLQKKQAEILDACYIKENGKPKCDCDEKHIFRTKTLQRLYELIYNELDVDKVFNPFYSNNFEFNGFIVYPDEQQAELKDTWNMSLGDRVKAHIKVLRKLRERK